LSAGLPPARGATPVISAERLLYYTVSVSGVGMAAKLVAPCRKADENLEARVSRRGGRERAACEQQTAN
jgi:hypothetical protein